MSSEYSARAALGAAFLGATVMFAASCAAPAVEVVNTPASVTDYGAARVPSNSQEAWDLPADELIENTTLGERIALLNPDILTNQQKAIDLLNPVWTEKDRAILDLASPRPSDKTDYTDQQLLNDISLSIATASIDADPDTSKQVLSIAVDPDTPEFTPLFQSFDLRPGGNASRAIYQTTKYYRPVLPGMEFMGTIIGPDEQGRITQSNSLTKNGTVDGEYFRLLKVSGEAGNQAVTQMGVWYESDPRVKAAIRNGNFQ